MKGLICFFALFFAVSLVNAQSCPNCPNGQCQIPTAIVPLRTAIYVGLDLPSKTPQGFAHKYADSYPGYPSGCIVVLANGKVESVWDWTATKQLDVATKGDTLPTCNGCNCYGPRSCKSGGCAVCPQCNWR